MEPSKKKQLLYSIRYTMAKKDIMTFVSGLHDMQADMIEELVRRSEGTGFPQATEVIDHIRSL